MADTEAFARPEGALAIKGLLLDLDGVVYVGNELLPGAKDAIGKIRASGLPFRFITNTTRQSRGQVVGKLRRLGLDVRPDDVFTPAALASEFLAARKIAPFLVTHPDLRADFADAPAGSGEAVVVGDAGEFFGYDLMNRAYRKLLHGAEFVALAKNRSFLDHDGELSLDAGPFVAALEYATGRQARVFGKPAADFFGQAVAALGCPAGAVAMIGDDVEADVGGAMAAGLFGVLVQTGKYREGHEASISPRPDLVARDLADAIARLPG